MLARGPAQVHAYVSAGISQRRTVAAGEGGRRGRPMAHRHVEDDADGRRRPRTPSPFTRRVHRVSIQIRTATRDSGSVVEQAGGWACV